MRMAVEEQEYRHFIGRKKIEVIEREREDQAIAQQEDFRFGTRGQWLAFSLAIIFLAVLMFLGWLGMETAVSCGFGAGGFIAIFSFLMPRLFAKGQKAKKDSSTIGFQ
jgi:uncharacterized membrane protein